MDERGQRESFDVTSATTLSLFISPSKHKFNSGGEERHAEIFDEDVTRKRLISNLIKI